MTVENADLEATPAGDVEGGEVRKSAREVAMEQIALQNLRKMEQESGVKLVDDIDEDDPPDDVDQLSQQLAGDPQPEPAPAAVATPAIRKVKVDGVELEVSDDDLIRTFQKNAAADKRLEEATRILREAEQIAVEQRAAAAAPAPAKKDTEPAPETSEEAKKQLGQALEKLYEGDKDTAVDLLSELLAQRGGNVPTPAAPQVDLNQIAAQVEERFAVNGALAKVSTDYPDILADPDLEVLTAMKMEGLISRGVPRAEAILSAAEDVYKKLGKPAAGRLESPPAATNTERLDRKKQMDQIPVASSAALSAPDANEDMSPSAVIREMAKRRLGQSVPGA